jgi:hypothetical protein
MMEKLESSVSVSGLLKVLQKPIRRRLAAASPVRQTPMHGAACDALMRGDPIMPRRLATGVFLSMSGWVSLECPRKLIHFL